MSTSGSLGANDSVENYADLFTVGLRNDDIQEFDSKWTKFFFGRIEQIKNTRVLEAQDRIGIV